MKLQIVILASLALLTTGLIYLSSQKQEKKYFKQFLSYKEKFQKLHPTPSELTYRYTIFAQNMKLIEKVNSQNKKYKLGINQFSDWTFAEFKQKYLSPMKIQKKFNLEKGLSTEWRGQKDWRITGDVTRVKNQQQCGSCWAFSTTGSLESAYSIFKRDQVELSEQELVDCAGGKYGNNGCNGGLMPNAFNYIMDNGIATEDDYVYTGTDDSCKRTEGEGRYSVSGFEQIDPVDINGLMIALEKQPVSVAIEVQEDFMQYESGVYENEDCGDALNHGVLAVAYVNDGTVDEGYVVIKNSWSPMWGDRGFAKLAVGPVGGRGTCGIANEAAVYPTL